MSTSRKSNTRRQPGADDVAKERQASGPYHCLVRNSGRGADNHWRYEQLKAQYTEAATTSAEYEAACRRATKEAGV